MLKKRFLYTLLGIAMSAMIAPQAMASVCLAYAYGTCVFYSGSVTCQNIDANGVGNVLKDPTFIRCTSSAPASTGVISGVVFCRNQGGNVSPGINGVLVGDVTGGITLNQSEVSKNGKVSGINVDSTVSAAELASLNGYCPNDNWSAIDFVPAAATITVQVVDDDTPSVLEAITDSNGVQLYPNGTDGDKDDADCASLGTCVNVISSATFDCTLPDPSTLTWDTAANAPEVRQYQCTQTGSTK